MASDIRNCESINIVKKIKLDDEFNLSKKENEHKDVIKSIKLEPSQSNNYLSSGDRSKDILLKVYPVINVSEDSKSQQKPVQFFVTNFPSLCSKDDIQTKVTESSRSSKNHSDTTAHIRPSEALFVRCLLPHCKRLAPLWFKGVSSMRDKNREEHRRISASTTCANQNDWERISELISDMNESTETETVVNLLKKLYKELPADMVLWFIKCWLKFPETMANEGKCSLSRGDARGRMRRIDGGKGSDKVWRLDTIVGMMFHGMPMSSTDTNIMVHTCDQELCIRPQHLRFKASSVALVAVLKALQQTGYSIIPPADDRYSINAGCGSPSDEFVDVSGPFKIEQLQQYRLEELKPYEQSMGKLNASSTDNSLLETYPILRNYYPSYGDDLQKAILECKSRRNAGSNNTVRPINDLKRPAQTTSNSTGSPPQIGDGSNHQCHSPPHLTSVKSINTEIAPTPRKVEIIHSHRINTFKRSDESPSSSIFSSCREKEIFGQAPDLMAEEPYEIKPTVSIDTLSSISRVTNESPIINGSNNGSGKNTPRQPAKKRLEARTPTFLVDDQPDGSSTVSSPLDKKLCTPNSNVSAFRVVPKKVVVNDLKPCDVEVAKIFDPCSQSEGQFLSEPIDGNNKDISTGSISELELTGNNLRMASETFLTTPSPLDYLFMAISQNHNRSTVDDHISLVGNGACSPTLEVEKPLTDFTTSYPIPNKSSSSIGCRFTPEQASALLNVIRNSPYGNNNPEIIDMLFNMMQQYPCMGEGPNGDHSHRPDSQLLRRQIYHQLCKASPQLDSCSNTPLLTEISNDDNISLRSSPYPNPINKSVFNPPPNAPKNKIFTTEN